jgi:CO dehydrogenase nickel-insertion accessory protein CooC1
MSNCLTVAVWGSKASGKTIFAAALAQQLTKIFYSVLLINTDIYMPSYAQWGVSLDFSKAEKENRKLESMGRIMDCPDITGEYIRQRIIVHPNNNKLGLMGYFIEEPCDLYKPIGGNAAQSFITEVKKTGVQVAVFDCTNPQSDAMTEKALKYADIVILLIEPNSIGIGFLKAQSRFVYNNLADERQYIFVASKIDRSSAVTDFEKLLGASFEKSRLPLTMQVQEKLNKGALFTSYDGEYGQTVVNISEKMKETAQ